MATPLQTVAQGVDYIWTPLCDQYGNPLTGSNGLPLGLAGVTGFTPFDMFPVRDLSMKGQLASGVISSFTVGSNIITLTAPATGLYPNSIFELVAGAGQYEYLITDPTYVAGSATVKTTTPVKNNFAYNTALWENPTALTKSGGPTQSTITPWGALPVSLIAYDLANDVYRGSQMDTFGNLLVATKLPSWVGIVENSLTGVSSWAGFDHNNANRYSQFLVRVNLTSISVGSITFFLSVVDFFGVAYQIATTTALSAPGKQAWTVGAGCQINQLPQGDLRLDATFAGGAVCSFTYDMYSR